MKGILLQLVGEVVSHATVYEGASETKLPHQISEWQRGREKRGFDFREEDLDTPETGTKDYSPKRWGCQGRKSVFRGQCVAWFLPLTHRSICT